MTYHDAQLRIQIEFIEMPGLKLSRDQVRRLCGVPATVCDEVLTALVRNGFLKQTTDGAFLSRGVAHASQQA
jgi:hypothetical protein